MQILDIFAGLGGASAAFKDRGWDVVTVDNDPRFDCTHTADLSTCCRTSCRRDNLPLMRQILDVDWSRVSTRSIIRAKCLRRTDRPRSRKSNRTGEFVDLATDSRKLQRRRVGVRC